MSSEFHTALPRVVNATNGSSFMPVVPAGTDTRLRMTGSSRPNNTAG